MTRGWLGVLALALFAWSGGPSPTTLAFANDSIVSTEGRLGRIVVPIGQSRSFRLPAPFADVIVGAAEIADVVPVSDRAVYILGKQIGTTNIAVADVNKRMIGVLDVEVTPDLGFIQSRIRQAVPAARSIRVSSANGTLVLSGSVPDGPTAERVVAIANAFGKGDGKVVNALQVTSPQQVLLEVRVIELSRSAGRELGVDLNGRGYGKSGYNLTTGVGGLLGSTTPFGTLFTNLFRNSNLNVDVTIRALEDKGLARRLASPNLTALSGAKANFQAGGEYPYPVPTGKDDPPSVQFKKYGVMIEFMPTVLDNGTINLRVSPEVSDLDFTNVVPVAGLGAVPGLTVRRTTTEVMLKSGQSFAVAGLLQENNRVEAAQLPWIGSLPVIGVLFRSQSFQKRETELVIIVTTHLARPGAPGDKIASPLDKTIPPNDVDLFVGGKFEIKKDYRNYVERGIGVVGPYGHVIEVAPAGVIPLTTRY